MASSTSKPSRTGSNESWTNKLNKALIAVGVIVLGLFVTDRLLDIFSVDTAPVQAVTLPTTNDNSAAAAVEVDPKAEAATAETVALADTAGVETGKPVVQAEPAVVPDETDTLVELQNLFGSRLVFVSAAEPVYVVTEDERRFEVGSLIGDNYSLAGIETDQLVIEREGALTVLSLPDPVTQ